MADFLGGSEIAAKVDMLNITNKVQQAELLTKKAQVKDGAYIAQLQKVSRDFESIFLSYMLKQMRRTVPETDLVGKTIAKDIFYEMHDEELSRELAKAGGIGLAAILYKQLMENTPVAEKKIKEISE